MSMAWIPGMDPQPAIQVANLALQIQVEALASVAVKVQLQHDRRGQDHKYNGSK